MRVERRRTEQNNRQEEGIFHDFFTKLDKISVPYQAAEKQRQEEAADDEANKISNEIEALEEKKQKIQDKIEGN